ncbi:MAG: glutamate--tRNA ligase, partial [Candidatus Vogelbacteria bacterium CG22_combo_CG10-13_8_21_14_all_37_9]
MNDNKIITRIAPSPTGFFHLGTARTALFNFLFTKAKGGTFILRIDDTDQERSKSEYTQDILDSLAWLGLNYDAVYHQSDRTNLYKQKLESLLEANKIYWSKEEATEPGQRAEVLRFRNPGQIVRFNDLVRGPIEFDTSELGDFVVAKDLDTPLYHFASVVDDCDLEISHIIRGEDHISNTPRQILMIEALGGKIPTYAHLPMILAPDKSKLSKRKHGEIAAIKTYQQTGYLAPALINFIALLGWSPQNNDKPEADEILSLSDLIKLFDLERVQKSSAIFNLEKLAWFNHQYLKTLSPAELLTQAETFLPVEFKNQSYYQTEIFEKVLPLLIERIKTLAEIGDIAKAGELDYFFQAPQFEKSLLKTTEFLPALKDLLDQLTEADWSAEKIKNQ